nr:clathrin heavy chain 1-like [Ipomoea batatas]GMC62144.1 clathrin heavy chain 1-like [Ipomoea batatas]
MLIGLLLVYLVVVRGSFSCMQDGGNLKETYIMHARNALILPKFQMFMTPPSMIFCIIHI